MTGTKNNANYLLKTLKNSSSLISKMLPCPLSYGIKPHYEETNNYIL